MGPEAGKLVRRSATTDRIPEMAGQPGSARAEAPKASPGTNAKVLLPALKELASGLGSQHDLVKEMVAAIQVGPIIAYATAQGLISPSFDSSDVLGICGVSVMAMMKQVRNSGIMPKL